MKYVVLDYLESINLKPQGSQVKRNFDFIKYSIL